MKWEASSTLYSCHDVLPYHRPQSSRTKWQWNEISQTMSQYKPFLLIRFISGIYCTDRKVTNKPSVTLLQCFSHAGLPDVPQTFQAASCLSSYCSLCCFLHGPSVSERFALVLSKVEMLLPLPSSIPNLIFHRMPDLPCVLINFLVHVLSAVWKCHRSLSIALTALSTISRISSTKSAK